MGLLSFLFDEVSRERIIARRKFDRLTKISDELRELEWERDMLVGAYIEDIMELGQGKYAIPKDILNKICALQRKIDIKQCELFPSKDLVRGIKSIAYYTPKGIVELVAHE